MAEHQKGSTPEIVQCSVCQQVWCLKCTNICSQCGSIHHEPVVKTN